MSEATKGYSGSDGLLSDKIKESWIWRFKVRLQFSGWMQYIPNGIAATAFLLVAGVGHLLGFAPLFLYWLPLSVSMILFTILLFDLVTVKFGLRPSEAIPSPKTDLDAFDLMRARHSCRSFQSRNLTEEHLKELVESARFHTQQERLLGEQAIRIEYIAEPITVWPTVGAHEFFVALAPKVYDRTAVIDVGRSLQKIVVKATQLGVATCWIGPGADHRSIAAHLGDRFNPEEDHIICVCALGYPSIFKPFTVRMATRAMSDRLPLSSLFFDGPAFEKALDTEAPPFDSYGRCYEVCQWAPSSFNSQTSRCAAVVTDVDGEETLSRFDFAASTHSQYYAPVAIGIWCANWEMGCDDLGRHGTFKVLTPEERNIQGAPELPRYDISWVVET